MKTVKRKYPKFFLFLLIFQATALPRLTGNIISPIPDLKITTTKLEYNSTSIDKKYIAANADEPIGNLLLKSYSNGVLNLSGKLKNYPDRNAKLKRMLYIITNQSKHPIRIINLENNNLTKIPKIIEKYKRLEVLFLANNQIQELPKEITNLQILTWLDLENNKLINLPNNIGKLKMLKRINLRCNSLFILPNSFYELNSIEEVDLRNNILCEINSHIGNLQNLVYLQLDNNNLMSIPYNIQKLEYLSWLSLRENNLDTKTLHFLNKLRNNKKGKMQISF